MSKVRVAVLGTVGKSVEFDPKATRGATLGTNVFLPNGDVGTPGTIRDYLGLGSGSTMLHRELQGLRTGDDHPQYTMWQDRENITGQWSFERPIWAADGTAALPEYTFTGDPNTGFYRVAADDVGLSTGGTLRWDASTTLINQTLPLRVQNNSGILIQNVRTGGTAGIEMQTIDGADADECGNIIGLWEASGRTHGFSIRHEGDEDNSGDLVFYRHSASTTGIPVLKFTRDSSQALFANGTNGDPAITFIDDDDTGIYRVTTNQIGFATAGVLRLTAGTSVFTATLPWQGPAGSFGTPTFSFSGDTNTGMYNVGADQLGFSTAGVLRLTASTTAFTATLPWLGPNGAVGAPTFSFSGDPNTGTYSVAADTLGVATGGVLRWSVSTTALTSTLPWLGPNGTASAPTFSFSGDPDTGVYNAATDTLGFASGGTYRMGVSNAVYFGVTPAEIAGVTGALLAGTTSLSSLRHEIVGVANQPALDMLRINGTLGAPTAVVNGNTLFQFNGYGYYDTGGPGVIVGGSLDFLALDNFTSTTAGTRLRLRLAPVGGTTLTEVLSVIQNSTGGQIRAPDGTAGQPAYSFLSDTNTGIYSSAANQLSFSVDGTERYRIESTGTNYFMNASAVLVSTLPLIAWQETDQAVDTQLWAALASSSQWSLRAYTDGFAASRLALVVSRTAGSAAISAIEYGNTTDNPPHLFRGVIRGTDGTASSPEFSFSNDGDTGIYRIGTDHLGLVTGGAKRVGVTHGSNATQLRLVSANAADLGGVYLRFLEDDDSTTKGFIGFTSTSDDHLSISNSETNANIRFTVTGTGQVTFPDGAVGTPSITFDSDLDTGMWRQAADTLAWSTAGAEKMRLTSTGGLAILDGITAPGASITGMAILYIDSADGDLKIRFADGTVKTIVVDT